MTTTKPTTTNRSRFASDRGAASPAGLIAVAAFALLALWSQGSIGGLRGGENLPGNDFASSFADSYSERRCKTDWVTEPADKCPWGQGDSYVEPAERPGVAGSSVEVASS